MRKTFFYLILFLVLPQSSFAQEDYLLPLKENNGLSSVFADHRSFHFHSGIDFKTGGKTGLKIYAAKAGWVYRLFTSWWGYGKVVYLKHPDGRFTVYAHLSDFSEKLKKLVTEKQYQNRSYNVDIFLKDTIWIEKGDVIGYSGQSGSGAPHLHFEIRDEKNSPLNPLTHGLSVQDSIAPIFQSLIIRPLDLNSNVDGSPDYKIYPLYFDSTQDVYKLRNIPYVNGNIGIEVSAYDKMAESGNRFGIYKLELFRDDMLVFSSRYDTIDFENSWKVELDRDFELLQKKEGEFYKLYLERGNDLPLYYTLDQGIVELTENELHQLTIQAEDVSGNISKAKIFLKAGGKPALYDLFLRKDESGYVIGGNLKEDERIRKISVDVSPLDKIYWRNLSRLEFESPLEGFSIQLGDSLEEPKLLRIKGIDDFGIESDYVYLLHGSDKIERRGIQKAIKSEVKYSLKDDFWIFKISFDQILKDMPEVLLRSGNIKVMPLSSRQLNENSYDFIFPFFELHLPGVILNIKTMDVFGNKMEEVRYLDIFIAEENRKAIVESIDGAAWVEIDSGSIFKRINLKVKELEKPEQVNQKTITPLYSFHPPTIPLAKPAKISLSYRGKNCEPSKTGLYEYTAGSFKFTGLEIDTVSNFISGSVRSLSTYTLLEDLKPPAIKKVYPKSGQKVRGKNLVISAWIRDELSGIGSEVDIEVLLDGKWLIPEYDPERFILISRPFKILSPGWHELVIKAKDRMGNEKEIINKFRVIM